MSHTPSTAVIGGGLAGVICARRLHEAGHAVQVFEKSRGIGGRMNARRDPDGAWWHGAQYFTAHTQEFEAQIQAWLADGVVQGWQPHLVTLTRYASHPAPAGRRFVGVPANSAPVRHTAQGLAVHLSHTVSHLQRDDQGWWLTTREGGRLPQPFQRVVLATPAPQAAALLATTSSPLLPRARAVNMRPCWALMLHYAEAPALPFDGAFVQDGGPLAWVAARHGSHQPNAAPGWLLHARADWSQLHLEDPPEKVARRLIDAFGDLGAPPPERWQAHRWRYAMVNHPDGVPCAWDPAQQLGLCGDGLLGSRVEDAWASGRAMAHHLLEAAERPA